MRRWLLILLLAILPVQIGWAWVGQYDGHKVTSIQAGVGGNEAESIDHVAVSVNGCVPGDAHSHAPALAPALASMDLGQLTDRNAYPPCTEQAAWGRAAPAIDRPKWPRIR